MTFKYQRSEKLENLLGLLRGYSESEQILFGQQNAGHIGVSISVNDGSESDCKNLCGKHPAVIGIDTLSFLGYEGNMTELCTVVKNMHRQGAIFTLSSHMPNFTLGGEEFYDYSSNYTEGDCARRIMPGGDLNSKYRKFLDLIAEFTERCVDVEGEKIPMLFRPFHECNGDWFWWGKNFITDEEYKELFRYTVDYLMNPQSALDAPRWQWIEGKQVWIEDRVAPKIIEELKAKGHEVTVMSDYTSFGRGQIIWRNEEGVLCGATEPRTDGTAY